MPNFNWVSGKPSLLYTPMGGNLLHFSSHLAFINGLWTICFLDQVSGNTLDLMFNSEPHRAGDPDVIPPLPGCDNSPEGAVVFTDHLIVFTDHLSYSLIFPIGSSDGHMKAWHRGHYGDLHHYLKMILIVNTALFNVKKSFSHFLSSFLYTTTHE